MEFQQIQNDFMDKYWEEFDESEENKLIYMDIFKEYVSTPWKFIDLMPDCPPNVLIWYFQTDVIEKYIEDKLQALVPDFEMAQLVQQIK